MKLAGDNRILNKQLEWHDFEGVLVSGFEDNWAGGTSLLDRKPAGGTDAPAVAGFEAGKAKLRHGCAEIVAKRLGGGQEGRRQSIHWVFPHDDYKAAQVVGCRGQPH